MRRAALAVTVAVAGAGCASAPVAGPLGEGAAPRADITGVDSSLPPRHATLQIAQPSYVALVLVAPGHSATLLFPRDSATPNRFEAGAHQLSFQIPDMLVRTDSMLRLSPIPRSDTSRIGASRRQGRGAALPPLPPTTPTYLLAVTSPQPLQYGRILEKTLGVSIPTIDTEALNAVGKAIKSTIPSEPRQWAGFYRLIELRDHR